MCATSHTGRVRWGIIFPMSNSPQRLPMCPALLVSAHAIESVFCRMTLAGPAQRAAGIDAAARTLIAHDPREAVTRWIWAHAPEEIPAWIVVRPNEDGGLSAYAWGSVPADAEDWREAYGPGALVLYRAGVEVCGHNVPLYGHDCDACDAGNAESDLLR